MRPRVNEAKWDKKNHRWRITEQRDGRRKPFYSSIEGIKGKIEAERKADDWLKYGDQPKEATFDELAASYLAHLRTGNGTAHKNREEATIRLYLPWKGRKVSSLSLLDYQDAIDACVEGREKPLSARTCGHVRSTIKALYMHARKANIKMVEPIGLTIPRAATKGQRHILQKEDIKKVFADNGYFAPMFQFICTTGLRPGEVCGLTNSDLKGNTLTIRRARNVQKETTSGKNENARRTITLPEQALEAVRKHRRKRKVSQWLFCSENGSQLDEKALYSAWRRTMERLDISHVSLYELRHTMISLVKDDMPLPMLKQVVGHSGSMDTLGTYGHEVDGEKDEAAAVISSVFTDILCVK